MYVKAWSRALVLLLAGCVSVVSWAEGFSGSMRVAPGDQKVLSFPSITRLGGWSAS